MRQGEGEVLGGELLDVGALDIVGLLELDDAEDLVVDVSTYGTPRAVAKSGGRNIR